MAAGDGRWFERGSATSPQARSQSNETYRSALRLLLAREIQTIVLATTATTRNAQTLSVGGARVQECLAIAGTYILDDSSTVRHRRSHHTTSNRVAANPLAEKAGRPTIRVRPTRCDCTWWELTTAILAGVWQTKAQQCTARTGRRTRPISAGLLVSRNACSCEKTAHFTGLTGGSSTLR